MTFDPLTNRYYSQCMFQHSGMELGDNLKACTTNALAKYLEINNVLPERIIVYRDGVGDGQVGSMYCKKYGRCGLGLGC